MTYSEHELEFTFAKNRTIVFSVVWTLYRKVTDRRTDGIPLANTALALRAMRTRCKNRRPLLPESLGPPARLPLERNLRFWTDIRSWRLSRNT